eukprot:scaffold31679_cov47-Attheya_sp.AAC.1
MAKLEVTSMEDLLDLIITEYQQVVTVPSGHILGNPYENANGSICLHLRAKCSYEIGFPRNFGEFYHGNKDNQKKHSMTKMEAFAWFARSRLRYGCSTLAASVSRFLIPKLKEKGVTSIYSKTVDKQIDLSNLQVYEVLFTPKYQHSLELDWGFTNKQDLVE